MALQLKQSLSLAQQLIMTPQLQQAIKLLQLSRLELLETIHTEMETNPVLEEHALDEGAGEKSLEHGDDAAAPSQDTSPKEDGRDSLDWETYISEYNTGWADSPYEPPPLRASPRARQIFIPISHGSCI
jgi:RNA polymerase sigma-54 factor